jgi:glutaredoxin/uncharacterized HAD superfamily protein
MFTEGAVMRIGVDIDGTVADYNIETTKKNHVGKELADNLFVCYIEATAGSGTGKGTLDVFLEYARQKPKLIKDSIEVMRRLMRKGHEVIIYTNRAAFMARKELEDWLQKYGIPYSQVWYDKTPPVLDYHIDDNPAKLVSLGTQVRHKVLINQPWNSSCTDEQMGERRVNGWLEFERLIESKEPVTGIEAAMLISRVHVQGRKSLDVILYALSTCPWCRKVKQLLDDLGIEYDYVYVDLLDDSERDTTVASLKKLHATLSFPMTVVSHGRVVVGYNEKEIREVIGND